MQQATTGEDAATQGLPGADRAGQQVMAGALRDQKLRQDRLRDVQAFLTAPAFVDLRDRPVLVSDPPEAIAARRRDLDYRIAVMESVLALMIEERDLLDRVIAGGAPETAPGTAPEMPPETVPEAAPAQP